MTRTKEIDANGNTVYTLTEDGQTVGYIHKCSGRYWAELPSGSGKSVTSIKKGEEIIAFWRRGLAA